ncbi:MAG: OmpH family outer membrane protein [Prevotellaceae bacterium]|jgi:outer membrane protein|nr:OmpH family outer membrane protein [Prevotellaceae bacterium]
MRKLLFFVFAAIACTSFQANAQTFKFGHINSAEIWSLMPDLDSVKIQLERTEKDLQAIINEVAAEAEKKYNEFQENQNKWSQVVKDSKQAELLDLNRRAQTQQQNAQSRMQQEQQRLLEPVQKKLKDAIDKVAKANGFTYVFDISVGSPVYVNETQSADISTLVKKELGITK